jgi:hypothetical protein
MAWCSVKAQGQPYLLPLPLLEALYIKILSEFSGRGFSDT